MSMTVAEQMAVIKRGCVELLVEKELEDKLATGRHFIRTVSRVSNRQIKPARLCDNARVLAVFSVHSIDIGVRASCGCFMAAVPGVPVHPDAGYDSFFICCFHSGSSFSPAFLVILLGLN